MTQAKIFAGAPALHHHASRRLFMRQASALSLVAGAGAPLALNLLAASSAAAQTAGDYKAVVCLFMFGGNDAFNTVLATDPASWAAYSQMRPEASIGLRRPGVLPNSSAGAGTPARLGGVLPLLPTNPQGREYALHPLLGKVQQLFNTERRLAVVANIGPLERPTSKTQYLNDLTHPKPPRLFSHNDQQSLWQTMQAEGATVGWGGRMADLIESSSGQKSAFTAVSAAGSAVWLAGKDVRQYQVSGAGPLRLGADGGGAVYGSQRVALDLNSMVSTAAGNHVFEQHMAEVARRSIKAELDLRGALPPAGDPGALQFLNPISGTLQFNALAHQLQVVARLVDAGRRGKTGTKRQVFFVSLGGFDTHSGQNQRHAELMARLDHALHYFDTALGATGARNSVTTFTASDFGRTFTSNGDGTDHGWGAHQLVMGGAVRGGDLYGTAPTLVARNQASDFNSPDQVRNGALIPTTSVDQLGATLGRWMGLSDNQLKEVFPKLAYFNQAPSQLGFMG